MNKTTLLDYFLNKGFTHENIGYHIPFFHPEEMLRRAVMGENGDLCYKVYDTLAYAKAVRSSIKEYKRLNIPQEFWFNRFLSSIEMDVARILFSINCRYSCQYMIRKLIPNYKKRTTVDFYLHDIKKVIECDGAYWHSSEAKKKSDHEVNILFRNNAIPLLRLTEKEIKGDKSALKSKILLFTNPPLNPKNSPH